MWVRGLKLLTARLTLTDILVAPYVGAWIETGEITIDDILARSHPMWVRGLKLPYP